MQLHGAIARGAVRDDTRCYSTSSELEPGAGWYYSLLGGPCHHVLPSVLTSVRVRDGSLRSR